MAKKIKNHDLSFSAYLNKRIDSRFTFKKINESYISDMIGQFKLKNSAGYDGISMKLLKLINSTRQDSTSMNLMTEVIKCDAIDTQALTPRLKPYCSCLVLD